MSEDFETRRAGRPALKAAVAQVAEQIIQDANREHSADAVMRETFKRLRVLNAEERKEISKAVFAYYRWLGWLKEEEEIEARIENALDLADRFQRSPSALAREELRAKAVPEWALTEVEAEDEWLRTLQYLPNLWIMAK